MKLLLLLLLALSFKSFSQQDTIPVVDNKVVYQQIDTASSTSKEILFKKAKLWAASVPIKIVSEDAESYTIICSHSFDVSIYKGVFKGDTYTAKCTIELSCKDERFRLKMSDIKVKDYPVEVMYSLYNKDKGGKKNYEDVFLWLSIEFKKLHSKLVEKMKAKDEW